MRGGEVTLEAILELLPNARLLTLVHVPGSVATCIEAHHPRPSFLQHLPLARTRYRQYLPLFPTAIEQFDLDDVDLVISTSHCAAKAVVPTGRSRHLCYCFTPMRYAWDQFDAYFGPARVGALRSRLYGFALRRLARWDAATADRVDRFVAISRYVAGRISRYYNRTAEVIEPPVDTSFYSPDGSAPGDYFIIVSALVPYKRVDLAIDACRLADVPLRVVGTGPEAARLHRPRRLERGVHRALLAGRSPRSLPRRPGVPAHRRGGFRNRSGGSTGLRAGRSSPWPGAGRARPWRTVRPVCSSRTRLPARSLRPSGRWTTGTSTRGSCGARRYASPVPGSRSACARRSRISSPHDG